MDIIGALIVFGFIFFYEKKMTNTKFALRKGVIFASCYLGLVLISHLLRFLGALAFGNAGIVLGFVVYLGIMFYFWFKLSNKVIPRIENFLTRKKIWVAYPIKMK